MKLYIVATPIGTLADLSPRAAQILAEVDVVYCEDTRHTAHLFGALGIQAKRLESLHGHNEQAKTPQIIDRILAGQTAALVTDAGTPAVSDPGAVLVEAAHQAGISVLSVPGPSSLAAALGAGGFEIAPKIFGEFFPRESKHRLVEVQKWLNLRPCVAVFFESPRRVCGTLSFLAGLADLADAQVCVSKEISKRFEKHWRGPLGEIAAQFAASSEPQGEFVVQVALPKKAVSSKSESEGSFLSQKHEVFEKVLSLKTQGQSLKEACKTVAATSGSSGSLGSGWSAKDLYAAFQAWHVPLSEKLEGVQEILVQALNQNLSRQDVLLVGPDVTEESAALAARIYKRGMKAHQRGDKLVSLEAQQLDQKDVLEASTHSVSQSGFSCPLQVFSESMLAAKLRDPNARGRWILVDEAMAKARPIWQSLRADSRVLFFLAQEENKTLETVVTLLQKIEGSEFFSEGVKEFWSVGGGITSDVGGFLAGLLGAQHHVVPTTLLSAVDAGIGGKTGVNMFPWGKNLVGLFQPISSFSYCPGVFDTLNTDELMSGLCEALKHCYLSGDALELRRNLAILETSSFGVEATSFGGEPPAFGVETVLWNMEFKTFVTEWDPTEKHVRAFLNFGHTLGHAWEALAIQGLVTKLPHGVAVGLGMWCLIKNHGTEMFDDPAIRESFLQGLESVLQSFGPSWMGSENDLKAAFEKAVLADKKNSNTQKVSFVVPPWGVFRERFSQQKELQFPPPDEPDSVQGQALARAWKKDWSVDRAWEIFCISKQLSRGPG